MPQILNGFTLEAEDILSLRQTYLRDYAKDFPPTYLSPYNMAKKANFVSDASLQDVTNGILADQQEELEAAWEEKANERLGFGDDDATAMAKADEVQKQIMLRLVTAEVFRMMLRDPEYRRSLFSAGSPTSGFDTIKQMEAVIEEYEAWAVSREGEYSFIEVDRH